MHVALDNNHHFVTPQLVSQRNGVWGTSAEICTDHVTLPRSGLCFWLVENLLQPIRSTTQIDPGSNTSSVWNFCTCSSETSGNKLQKCWLYCQAIIFYGKATWQNAKLLNWQIIPKNFWVLCFVFYVLWSGGIVTELHVHAVLKSYLDPVFSSIWFFSELLQLH